jgi:hypothetical protein
LSRFDVFFACFFYFVSQCWLEAEEMLARINKLAAENAAKYYQPVYIPKGDKGERRCNRGAGPRGKP